jgi:hypothetical protein
MHRPDDAVSVRRRRREDQLDATRLAIAGRKNVGLVAIETAEKA